MSMIIKLPIFYYHSKVRKVEAIPVAAILSEKLDCSDTDLAEILSKILRISRTKSYNIVKKVRHQEDLDKHK